MASSGWGSIANILTSGLQTYEQSQASNTANAQEQSAIGNAGTQLNTAYGQAEQQYQPYSTIGLGATQNLQAGAASGAYNLPQYQQYQPTQAQPNAPTNQFASYQAPAFNYQESPGYQFQLNQGTQAIQSQAGGAGMFFSGATQKALARYGTGLAASDYQNQFNNYVNQRNFTYQNLANAQAQNNQMYGLGLQQYNTNRTYGAGQNLLGYQSQVAQQQNKYGQQANLAALGPKSAGDLASLYSNLGIGQANLALQSGGANAANTMQQGNLISNFIGNFGTQASGGMGQGQGQQSGGGMNLGSLFGGSQSTGSTGSPDTGGAETSDMGESA